MVHLSAAMYLVRVDSNSQRLVEKGNTNSNEKQITKFSYTKINRVLLPATPAPKHPGTGDASSPVLR